MKKVLIEIDDHYAGAISITVVGGGFNSINMSTTTADLTKTDKIIIDKNGKSKTIKGENNNA